MPSRRNRKRRLREARLAASQPKTASEAVEEFDREKALEVIAEHNPKIKGLAKGWTDETLQKYFKEKELEIV